MGARITVTIITGTMKRQTQQRDVICRVLEVAGRPLSVNEILGLAKSVVPGLGIATVYRNLKTLQEEKRVVPVNLPGQPPRWEMLINGHHHHFLCRMCDKLFEVKDCPEDLARLLPPGYTLEDHDILLRGLCESCSRRKKT